MPDTNRKFEGASELDRLKQELQLVTSLREMLLGQIARQHAAVTAIVHEEVRDFERRLYNEDPEVVSAFRQIDELRAEHHPLRTRTWELQARIKELENVSKD